MTGVSEATRSPSSHVSVFECVYRWRRPAHAAHGLLGRSVLLTALAALGCQSELSEGPGDTGDVPGFSGNSPAPGTPVGGSPLEPGSSPSSPVPGAPTDGSAVPGTSGPITSEGVVDPSGIANAPPDPLGTITDTNDSGPVVDAAGMPLPVDQLPPLQACNTPGPQLVRRLNSAQFRNTLASVFGAENLPDSNPLNDPLTLGYDIDSDALVIQGLDAQAVGSMAEEIAAAVRENGGIERLAGNCTRIEDVTCREQFVRNLGEQLSREPLGAERVSRYAELFTLTAEDGTPLSTSFEEGAELVIAALIQSPYTLYRREIGVAQGAEFVLTPYEVASELSYMLTNSPPDAELMAAAGAGQLASAEQIVSQATRLLGSAQAEAVLGKFVTAWLDVDRLIGKVKAGVDISDGLRAAMLGETEQLFLHVFQTGGTIGDLLASTSTFMNQELAEFYGIDGVSGDGFVEVDISGGVRVPGVLGHGSYLAAHALADNSSPVQRAFVVRERMLCNDLPAVPTDLDTNLKEQAPGATSRERYATHSSNAVCQNCHQLMDPVGFTFESYDGYGIFRATEAGQPVDTTGGLALMDESGPIGVNIPLGSVTDLANYLAQSEQTRACLINNMSYYAYGVANRAKWSPADKVCTDHFIRQVARDGGNTLESVMIGILTAPHFTRRTVAN